MPAKGAGAIFRIDSSSAVCSVLVVGAGICGLAAAWRLAESGLDVRVVDAGPIGHAATWAAGGMLAASLEAEPGEEAMVELAHWSQGLWPEWAACLVRTTGIDVGYRGEGTLQVATTRDEMAALRHRYAYLRRLGLPVEWRDAGPLRDLEPGLSPDTMGAIASPTDHQVDPRAVVPALVAALEAAGGSVAAHRRVTGMTRQRDTWSVRFEDGEACQADHVVLAAGAWAGQIEGVPALARPPVRPAKGQAVMLQMDAAAPLLRHVIWGAGIYLIPRADGRLYIGATVEDRGFDVAPTAGGVLSLLEAAWRIVPAIEELPIVELVCGLRPRSRDDLPIVGPSGIPGLHLATGHHRNGILLAPATAELVAAGVLGREPPIAASAFHPARFAAKAEVEVTA